MKINEIYGPATPGKKAGKTKESQGIDFQRILDGRLQPAPTAETTKANSASPVFSVSEKAHIRMDSLALSEKTIATLTEYERALLNRSLTNEDLKPFVETMEEEASELMAMKKEIPGDDPLAALLDRVATVSYLEAAKFRRGDYEKV